VIRKARFEDAPALAALTTQLGYPSTPEEIAARLRDVLARPEGAVLVAEVDGAVAGWIQVVGVHSIETEPHALISGLVVHEARRSLGLGAALVRAAAEWAAGHDYRTLRVRSNIVRERAHAFYERLGFERTKAQVMLVLPLAK
jgi:GNAT superfamily N-acetyltransferase